MLLLVPLINGLVYEQGKSYDLKVPCFNNGTYCSDTAECNITVIAPNSSLVVNNKLMTNNLAYHNYTMLGSNHTGTYQASVMCDDSTIAGYTTFEYELTGNGRERPEGIVIVLFSLVFLALLGAMTYLMIYSIGHIIRMDLDMVDLALNYGGYFMLYGLAVLQAEYLGQATISWIINLAIDIGVYTNILVPSFAFIISFIRRAMNNEN